MNYVIEKRIYIAESNVKTASLVSDEKLRRQDAVDALEPRAPGHQRHNFIFKLFPDNHSIVIK